MSLPSKPFLIDKRQVYEAYLEVRSKEGAGGVDGVTIEQFEKDLKSNLYKIWNRMSSGAYFPPPVRAVTIPKKNGGQRILGVPTVADRVAQTVVKQMIEPALEKIFLADSYGYRPDKSALDAVGITREPWQPIPGPNHHVRMSSRPLSHMSYGGIDCVASSWMSEVSASMSYCSNAWT